MSALSRTKAPSRTKPGVRDERIVFDDARPEPATSPAASPAAASRAKPGAAGSRKEVRTRKPSRTPRLGGAPIVPRRSVAGRALVFVVAIMTCLLSLTLGAVSLVSERADAWARDVSREVTVQVRPARDLDMEAALREAAGIARATPGVLEAAIVPADTSLKLLEPWLGAGFDASELPVPRLVRVEIEPGAWPDLADMSARLEAALPEASLDDHRVWVSRLTRMARATILGGLAVLALMLAATVLIVVFATRAAMAGNAHVIEVLHFVGAERGYIASQFQTHFLLLGLGGACLGGAAALGALLWLGTREPDITAPEAQQFDALVGTVAVGPAIVVGVALIVAVVALLAAVTSRLTVLRTLGSLDG